MSTGFVKAKYYIQQYTQQDYFHGGIGAADAEKILASLGYVPIQMPHHFDFSLRAKFRRLLFILKMSRNIEKGSVVVFLFPVYAKMTKLLLSLLRKKNVKLVCMIMDLEGMRDADERLLKTEARQISKWNSFIVPNNAMKSVIERYSPGSSFGVLKLFDFLVGPGTKPKTKGFDIAFAGNLEKSMFLSALDSVRFNFVRVNVYGAGFPKTAPQGNSINYRGTCTPGVMPNVIEGSFGLVWDGDSTNTCSGSYGEYLRYNSPHKLSLYIVSELPIIIWEEAATASFVIQYGIGIAVKNLDEVESKIRSISDEQYLQMQKNMQPLAERIRKGENLANALRELLNK